MVSDIRAAAARDHHRAAAEAGRQADQHRSQRDELVRLLRSEDPGRWTYRALAGAVGCSPELIAVIVRSETKIERERQQLSQGICPQSGKRIMPGGSLRPACALCNCGED